LAVPSKIIAARASERFTKALDRLAAAGQKIPCSDSADLWLSESQHARAEAARLCRGCPVIAECRAAAKARGERFGVWGGKDFTRKTNRPKAKAPA
jgi:hypothetical protein